jgi:hypothetical protein
MTTQDKITAREEIIIDCKARIQTLKYNINLMKYQIKAHKEVIKRFRSKK